MDTKNKSLAIKNTYFSPEVWEQMKNMSEVFIQSQALPSNIKNASQAIMIMQAGYEMGMKPLEAIKSLYIVNGQINIYGAALIRRLREHGWRVEYKNNVDKDDVGVTAIIRKDKEKYEQLATYASAERSGYTKDSYGKEKVGWKSGVNRQLKLRYLAVSMLIKTYVPEVLGSASDVQEIAEDFVVEDVNTESKEDSNVITSDPQEHATSLKNFLDKNKNKNKKEEVEEVTPVETKPEEEKTNE